MSLLMPMITNVELFVPSRYRYKLFKTPRRRASWRRGERCQRTGVVARDAVWNIEKNECVVMKVMKVMRCDRKLTGGAPQREEASCVVSMQLQLQPPRQLRDTSADTLRLMRNVTRKVAVVKSSFV